MTTPPTLPLSHLLAVGLMHSYHGLKSFKWLRVQGLSESIFNHVFCRYISNGNLFGLNFFSDPIVSHFNMFSASMELMICCEPNGSSIIGS